MSLLHLRTADVDLTFLQVARRDGTSVALTETEGAILRHLAQNAHRDIERDELRTVLGRAAPSGRAIDIAVARLRAKLGEPKSPTHIRTVRGVGYRFVASDEGSAGGGSATDSAAAPKADAVVHLHGGDGAGAIQLGTTRIATGRIDLVRRRFLRDGDEPVQLGKLDADLLERLVPGAAVPRERLIREIWGRGKHERSLTAALRRLRAKLGDSDPPAILVSVPGSAVRLVRAGEDSYEARTNLRPQRTTFVGRPEVRALVDLLDGPLVTIRGPAGTGKTRLAYEVGLQLLRDHPTIEVWFCDLTCALAEQGIVRAVETTLGIDEVSTEDTAGRVLRVLARKPPGTVVILDNFDQVTHHATPLEAWVTKAPNVRFIATSRHALGLPNERCLDVGPLDVAAAAELFVDRAAAARPLDARSVSVRTLVTHLDCLPLAIELAAARATDFSTDDLIARLNDRLNWLVRPPVGAVSPHRSLRGALDWSWDLLNDDARTALAECAVFARDFTTELARELLSVPAVAPVLAHLADRSLLYRETHTSWRMYEGIREYAREKAILLGLWDRTAERHAELCVRRATDAGGRMHGASLIAALTELRRLRDELLAIHTRSSSTSLRIRAAVVLCPLLQTDGPRELVLSVCTEALKYAPPPEQAWRLWVALGEVGRLSCRFEQAIDHLRNGIHAAAQVGERPRAIATCELAFTLTDVGRAGEAEPMLREVLTVFRAVGDRARESDCLRYLAKIRGVGGSLDDAVAQLEEVRTIVAQTRDPLRAYLVHRDLMLLQLRRADLNRAETAIGDAIRWARELKLRRGEYDALRWLSQLCRQRGDHQGAARLLEEAREGYEALGDDGRAQLMRRMLALVSIEAGRFEVAEQALVHACAEPEADAENRLADLGNLAIVWHLQGRLDAAIHALHRLVERIGHGRLLCPVIGHLAAVYADDDQVELAVDSLAEARGISVPPVEPFLRLCGAVVELAKGRAGLVPLEDAVARARSELRAVTRPGPGDGPSVAQRDQDVSIARMIVEHALARSQIGVASTA